MLTANSPNAFTRSTSLLTGEPPVVPLSATGTTGGAGVIPRGAAPLGPLSRSEGTKFYYVRVRRTTEEVHSVLRQGRVIPV